MRYLFFSALMGLLLNSCNQSPTPKALPDTAGFNKMLDDYYHERLNFYPLDAALQGAEGYNDKLPIDVSVTFRKDLKAFYTKYQAELAKLNPSAFNDNDRISYDILKWECELGLEGLQFPDNYLSINQFYSLPLTLGQYGSGSGPQPFKTVQDYDNWLKRIGQFPQWCDSAIVYMRTGMGKGYVLPTVLIKKVIPQKDLIKTIESMGFSPEQFRWEITPSTYTSKNGDTIPAITTKGLTIIYGILQPLQIKTAGQKATLAYPAVTDEQYYTMVQKG